MLKNLNMKTIKELNEIMQKSRQSKLDAGLNAKTIRKKQAQWEGGKANKGIKHSEETKKMWSEAHKGKKMPSDVVKKSIKGQIETKWQLTLKRLSKDDILNAQKKHGNHQSNTMKELKISFIPYKKLCKHYGIELKKSKEEKAEWAKKNQSTAIYAWKEGKSGKAIGKPKKFYSVNECMRVLKIPNKSRMLEKIKNNLPYHGWFFKKDLEN